MKRSSITIAKAVLETFVLGLLLTASPFAALAQRPADTPAKQDPLVGLWKSPEATTEIRPDGTIIINGEKYTYKVNKSVIRVSDGLDYLLFPFELDGDTLTVLVNGREVVYKRQKGAGVESKADKSVAAEGVIPAFVGKWCYMSSMTGSNAFLSSRCFTLYQNGTYEFSAESSTSGAYGSTAGQSYDTGRWTATRTTLTAYSTKHGKIVYPIELRNHPKNGDPMIVVDGDAYVTAYRKDPW